MTAYRLWRVGRNCSASPSLAGEPGSGGSLPKGRAVGLNCGATHSGRSTVNECAEKVYGASQRHIIPNSPVGLVGKASCPDVTKRFAGLWSMDRP